MRKLSKKISMLMVLAMLVSLFSGIVSASAASAWSFKSSKYDVDVKETIVMDKNEYADFDLLKEDVEVTKATYTVKWESSDEDVVWVNAKTGQLRADKFGEAEAGDKAKISATFTNVATKKSATRYFYIEIADDAEYEITVNFGDEAFVAGQKYDLAATVKADGKEVEAKVEFSIDGKAIDAAYTPAEAGEVTIVAVATIDGKEVAKSETKVVVDAAGLESAKQTSFNAVALTFGSADVAKAVAADASKIGSVYYIGENEIQAFVSGAKVDEKNANVVNVTLYNTIAKGVTYKFTYADKSATVVGSDLNQISSITIATTAVPAGNWETVKVNLYNELGVLVGTTDAGFTLNADISGAYNVSGNQIQFTDVNANASATVTATYWMPYDNNGNKIADLKATAIISSYNADAVSFSNIKSWSLSGQDWDWSASNTSKNLVVNEAQQLHFKADKFDRNGNKVADEVFSGATNAFAGGTLKFVSTNENVVVVDVNSGRFVPVSVGAAQIIVYRYYNNDFDGTKQVIGIYNVNVAAASRSFTSANAYVTNKKLSSGVADSYTYLIPNSLDQLGENYYSVWCEFKLEKAPTNVTVTVTGVDGNNAPMTTNLTTDKQYIGLTQSIEASDWKNFVTVTATVDDSTKYYDNTVLIGVTTHNGDNTKEIYKVVPVSVAVPGKVSKYDLSAVKGNIDMNLLTKRDDADITRFHTEVKLSLYDGNGYLVDILDTDAELPYGKEAAVTGGYYWTVLKNGQDAKNDFVGRSLKAITASDNNGETRVTKNITAGTTYTVQIWQNVDGVQVFRASKNISITDTTPKTTVVKVSNKVSTTDGDAVGAELIRDVLQFVQNGQVIPNNDNRLWTGAIDWNRTEVDSNRLSIYKVQIGRWYAVGNYYEWVDVYTTFEKK